MERRGGKRSVSLTSLSLSLCVDNYLKAVVFVPQVFMFVQNLIGCEEQARLFKEEVRPQGVCESTLKVCLFHPRDD